MDKIIAYARLPFELNISAAQKEIKSILNREKQHFNTSHYIGEWTVIALRSPGGKADTIVADNIHQELFEDTELMHQCPSIKELIQSFTCPVMSVRLLNLKKGSSVKEHSDKELSFEKGEARLHFPLVTNNQVEFYVEGKQVLMQEGECWYINANLPHRVSNFGETDRIHLVIDCIVNDWLRQWFDEADKNYSTEAGNRNELKMIIAELRHQNTETSNKIASQLEAALHDK